MKKHGISIGIDRIGSEFFLSIKAVGKLTHDDYELMIPMIESALDGVDEPSIKVIVDITQFDGWELKAAWDDFKFALKHDKEFSKIAIYGNSGISKIVSNISSWFVSAQVSYFDSYEDALKWLNKKSIKSMDSVEKELESRQKDIENSIENLFKKHMRITDLDVPEADDQKAAMILIDIFENQVAKIRKDVADRKYEYY